MKFCTSKRQALKSLEASASLLTIYPVFDTLTDFVGKPDSTKGVRVHWFWKFARFLNSFLAISRRHSQSSSRLAGLFWVRVSPFCSAGASLSPVVPDPTTLKSPWLSNRFSDYIGLYSEKACEAYRQMWSELSVSNRTINHTSSNTIEWLYNKLCLYFWRLIIIRPF